MATAIPLFIIFFAVLIYVFYRAVVTGAMALVNLIFVLCVIVSLSTIFLPEIYSSFARDLVDQSIFVEEIKTTDSILTGIVSVPNDIVTGIDTLFNGEDKNAEEVKVNLYEGFVAFLTSFLRITLFTVSVIGMLFMLYFRYTFVGISEANKLHKELKNLKQRISLLEEASE